MKKVGIIGASGFAGEELVKFLNLHNASSLIAVSSRELKGKNMSNFVEQTNLTFVDPDDDIFFQCDVIFFATPHGVSMEKVKYYLENGIKVIDLSADFRLKNPETWKKWYGTEHTDLENLEKSVYGLTELNSKKIKDANLIAVPGCYPTASILALAPLMEGGFNIDSITIDAKSGISGAGRSTVENNLRDEIKENFRAYATSGHRHLPEIEQTLVEIYGYELSINFLPHLIPAMRGIYATTYVNFVDDSKKNFVDVYNDFYKDSPNVSILLEGEIPEILKVSRTNNCHIGLYPSAIDNQIVIISAIDNLVKGAAGQAMECYNLICGHKQTEGLTNG
tara:strand:- start:251 stop:1258 length:1008 start_codon:yes stop_codon:yes gene_type:complete